MKTFIITTDTGYTEDNNHQETMNLQVLSILKAETAEEARTKCVIEWTEYLESEDVTWAQQLAAFEDKFESIDTLGVRELA